MSLLAACAQPKPPNAFETAFDEQQPWVEIEAQLPPAPVATDMVPFDVSGATSYRFAIDSRSLSIGSDGVFRYTLVATSPSGVRNVTYEGIKCDTNQKKTYAIGRSDGTWVRARNAAWTSIEDVAGNRQHAALEKEYFCPESYAARNTKDVFYRMNQHLPSSEGSFDRNASGVPVR